MVCFREPRKRPPSPIPPRRRPVLVPEHTPAADHRGCPRVPFCRRHVVHPRQGGEGGGFAAGQAGGIAAGDRGCAPPVGVLPGQHQPAGARPPVEDGELFSSFYFILFYLEFLLLGVFWVCVRVCSCSCIFVLVLLGVRAPLDMSFPLEDVKYRRLLTSTPPPRGGAVTRHSCLVAAFSRE